MKRVVVLSLGGSLIIPGEVGTKFLESFKIVVKKNLSKHKFVVVCGGGSVARKYISSLRKIGVGEKLQSLAGISATRMNARFMSYFFSQDSEFGIPHRMKLVDDYLKKNDVVFCGALEYKPHQTSDSTAADIAKYLKTGFINLTDVPGLYDKNPKKFKDAKFISEISWKGFHRLATSMKYSPGQHFVLDQKASKIIMENKITTYILGKDMRQLDNLLNGRKFTGTKICG